MSDKPECDPSFQAEDFLHAELVVDSLLQNLAIQFQTEGESFDRATMQKHVNKRCALLMTKGLLLDEGERLLNAQP